MRKDLASQCGDQKKNKKFSCFRIKSHSAKLSLIAFLFPALISAQQIGVVFKTDTLSISLQDAENKFVKDNLMLLAAKYNVEASKALTIQAKLYPNPTFTYTNTIRNITNNNKLFDQSSKSDYAPQITQLIVLAGKIKKQTKVAETNSKIAEDNLYDLLRTLKFALRNGFYNIHYLRQTAKVYDEEMNSLRLIITAYNGVQDKGYFSRADFVRVQAQLYSLESEYQALIDSLNDQESQLRLLLQLAPNIYIEPVVDTGIVKTDPLSFPLKTLLDSAYVNRTDLMIANDNVRLSQQNLSLQKALAVPDLTFGPGFVKKSNYVDNDYVYVIGFSLPIFNRNQGNIKNAKIQIDNTNTQLEYTKKQLEEQVYRGLQKAVDADHLVKEINPVFSSDFDKLAKEMAKNYMKKNVSLLDFITFYDAYKQNVVQVNSILFNKISALENLNYLTGTSLFN